MHDDKCITVFSAPNYCGSVGNKGAVVNFKEDMQPSFKQFDAAAKVCILLHCCNFCGFLSRFFWGGCFFTLFSHPMLNHVLLRCSLPRRRVVIYRRPGNASGGVLHTSLKEGDRGLRCRNSE